jgi:phage terminase large subunit
MADVRRIVLDYAPRSQFIPFHDRPQRWAVIVAHRRAGKTVACVNDAIRRAIQLAIPHGRYAYVAPFLTQAKQVAWEYIKHYARPIAANSNESELWVQLINGARIRIHGAENPDRLRGDYLDGIVLDEYADMRPSVWGEVIRPMLADRQGWATFIGTPKGRNEFFKLYDGATLGWPQPDNTRIFDPEWFSLALKASETGILPQSELDSSRAMMTPEQYEQEYECSFDAAIMGAYFGKEIAELERQGRVCQVAHDPALPTYTAWDLGIGDPTAIWVWQIGPDSDIRVLDYYENSGFPIPHYVEELAQRGWPVGIDYVPHDARVRSLDTGRTRVETLLALRRKPSVVSDHKVMDSINGARLVLPICRFDTERCRQGLEALRQYKADFDEKLRTFKSEPRHDWASHGADAFRVLGAAYRELKPAAKPKDPPRFEYSVDPATGVIKSGVTFADIMKRQAKRQRRH